MVFDALKPRPPIECYHDMCLEKLPIRLSGWDFRRKTKTPKIKSIERKVGPASVGMFPFAHSLRARMPMSCPDALTVRNTP